MNLHDRIVATLRGGPLDFSELRTAVNAETDPRHPWSTEWFALQLEILMWRGYVERRGTSYRVVEKERNDLDSPETFKITPG